MKPAICLESEILDFTGVQLCNPFRITIPQGVTVVIGPNGAGKTTLGNILERGWNFRSNKLSTPSGEKIEVRRIEFSDIHSLSGMKVEYYQQRYEATMNDEVPTVAEIVGAGVESEQWAKLTTLFHLQNIESNKINFLSSGELRKLLIINALLTPADAIVLDNPYIGLDSESRQTLNEAIKSLTDEGVAVILLIANPDDLPDFVDCIVPMRKLKIGEPITQFPSMLRMRNRLVSLFDFAVDVSSISAPMPDPEQISTVVKLDGCTVRYGNRTIVDNVDWEIRDCENWSLSGPNGSGKSTLLSLICADNPQGYSNRITLFDRRRGSGESIWDIKRRIAMISPERTLHFHPAGDVRTIIAQGLNDTSGVFIAPKPIQLELADKWISLLHLEDLVGRNFTTLSSGERQMVMLARVFIKQPRLMILDEPFHGLDLARQRAVRAIINHFAARAKSDRQRFPMSIIIVTHYESELPECVEFTKQL